MRRHFRIPGYQGIRISADKETMRMVGRIRERETKKNQR